MGFFETVEENGNEDDQHNDDDPFYQSDELNGSALHHRWASLPSGDDVMATATATKNLGLQKLDFALGK
ncbi:hypothetical protein LWI29_022504 [Acer saccharum]|uniref:Uncharacterized protein n=1 Tax=Acer saccharum TaxID=4024 RepID=A0AA39VFU0_ACESA|nr:hypothetical protein LWI29_022504 [Acer saccharum]